ncbi:MAG TPA: hypothetical protein VJY84_01330 [Candidatus Saccharimonadales bacterium]|nr:hypothetical protein [Candidatus Saccharimonadales bacterium]
MLKDNLDHIMNSEVNRAEFMRYIGVAMLSMIGVVAFVRNLHSLVPARNGKKRAISGYGGNAYGR